VTAGHEPPAPGPVRTCVGCRKRHSTDRLARVVRYPDGSLTVDRLAPGRGAWVCRDPDGVLREACLELAVRRSAFGRALRATISASAVEALKATQTERARIEDAAAEAATCGRD